MVTSRAVVKGNLVAAVAGVAVLGLAFMNAAVAQLSCRAWPDSEVFFKAATVADVSRCLAAGANIEARGGEYGWTPLHATARYSESPEVVKALLDAGANLEAGDVFGMTPLHQVVSHSVSPEVVKVLIDAGADLEAFHSPRGQPPLMPLHMAAAYSKSPEIVKALVDAGAYIEERIEASIHQRWTPLHNAAKSSISPEIEKALLAAGANPDTKALDDSTARG